MNSDDDHGNHNTPPDICEASTEVAGKLLPVKSIKTYKKSYKFMAWKEVKNSESFSQRVLLVYFNELSKSWKSTTLWSEYSKLRTMIQHNHQIDINYPDLKRFLENLSKNTDNDTKKANTFSSNDIERFLNNIRFSPINTSHSALVSKCTISVVANFNCRQYKQIKYTTDLRVIHCHLIRSHS
ncbi:uncharacterized protein LOC125502141 [Athalia rosae]|uniref:uncharacterized protein LOC125502141 n=1 Tax=Athalia rosae TaxID=37344 RepID=UPI0020335816|nr:uncharacterized protein LOC125502141 [Athalia rosae]